MKHNRKAYKAYSFKDICGFCPELRKFGGQEPSAEGYQDILNIISLVTINGYNFDHTLAGFGLGAIFVFSMEIISV